MKQIIFLVVDFGVDGRGSRSIRFATTDEAERDNFYNTSPNKGYYNCEDAIFDLGAVALSVWKKLDAVEKLSLLSTNAPMWKDSFVEKTVGDKAIKELT